MIVILGSGLGELGEKLAKRIEISYADRMKEI
jgi:hypothetical protein